MTATHGQQPLTSDLHVADALVDEGPWLSERRATESRASCLPVGQIRYRLTYDLSRGSLLLIFEILALQQTDHHAMLEHRVRTRFGKAAIISHRAPPTVRRVFF